ncbi:MAG: hypothetical protein ACTSW1_19685 [Candidatus Hodarchaeales archaeon]
MKKDTYQVSVNEFLNLNTRNWTIELDARDFTLTLSKLMEIPLKIYKKSYKDYLLQFLRLFLEEARISFILRHNEGKHKPMEPHIDLAIVGCCENKKCAIPLWVMHDLLIGFEILKNEDYTILDSENLNYKTFHDNINFNNSSYHNTLIEFEDEFFQGSKLCLEINNGEVWFSKYFNDTLFLERIANTPIPELDDQANQNEL